MTTEEEERLLEQEQQRLWDVAVNAYGKTWRLNNTTADRSALAASRREAESFFERELPKERRSTSGKTFDDFFQAVEEAIEWG
jgi:hypothetical protein